MCLMDAYQFLLDTYETEVMKTLGIWSAFPASAMEYRPHPRSRSVVELFEHQVQSEGRWMANMLGIDTGDPSPVECTSEAFIGKYRADADQRLAALHWKQDAWWNEPTTFFDVTRSRAWVFTRRLLHSAHHRGELVLYLRQLDIRVPSVYGPTADTEGEVMYTFAE
ncbi:MAG: DinB family protein [Armatimonadota bacterium]